MSEISGPCPSCGQTGGHDPSIPHPHPPATPPTAPGWTTASAEASRAYWQSPPAVGSVVARGGGNSAALIGCLVAPVILLFGMIGLLGLSVLGLSGGRSTGGLRDDAAVVLPIPGADGRAWIVETPSYPSGLQRVDAGDDDPVWKSERLDDMGSVPQVAVDDRHVYVADGARVLALDLASGDTAWTATLADDVEYADTCTGCFELVDDRLVVLTIDAEVHALDVADGNEVWSHRFADTSGRALVVDRSVVLVDQREADLPGAELRVVDVADGADRARAVPSCPVAEAGDRTGHLSTSSAMIGVDDPPAVLVEIEGDVGCRLRVDLATGDTVWSTPADVATTLDSELLLQAEDAIFIGTYDGIERIDLATGEQHTVVESEGDETIEPTGMAGDVLLAASTVRRGTPKTRLVGIDPGTGTRLWTHDLGQARPFGRDSSTHQLHGAAPGWLWAEGTDGAIRVLTFSKDRDTSEAGAAITIQELDPRTGEPEPRVESDIETDSTFAVELEVLDRGDDRLLLRVDRSLQTLDVRTGEVVARWP